MNLIWLFLPGILYLGIKTSYTDIKYGKIRNRDVVFLLLYAVILYLAIFVFYLLNQKVNYLFFIEVLTNMFFALIVGFSLWAFRLWSAGDGKLFFAFALLLPPNVYFYSRYTWIPSLTLLVNIFLVGLMVVFIFILKEGKLKNYKSAFKDFLSDFLKPFNLISTIIFMFAVFWIAQLFLNMIGFREKLMLRYVLSLVIFSQTPNLIAFLFSEQALKKNRTKGLFFMFLLGIFRVVTDKSIYSYDFVLSFISLIFFWVFIRGLFNQVLSSLGDSLFSKEVKINSVKPGMMLAGHITKLKRIEDVEAKERAVDGSIIVHKGKFSYIMAKKGDTFMDIESEGLIQKQIDQIKKVGFKKIRIASGTYFAPLIFLGVLLTILVKGNILILIHILVN